MAEACWESMCDDCGVSRTEMATLKKHGMTDGLAVKCNELGVNAKGLRDLFFQFGPPCVPILMEFAHKAKAKKEPAKPKDDEPPAPAHEKKAKVDKDEPPAKADKK